MNKLIVIGVTSMLKCYLNITKEEAQARYITEEGELDYISVSIEDFTTVIEFKDEFEAYQVWEK